MAKDKQYSEEVQRLLKQVMDECDNEDRAIRERQLRTWRRLRLMWEGFSQIWYSEVAHDWRVYDSTSVNETDSTNQAAYDKPVNVFRAYLESIIAALSITIPAVKCYPDDANNVLDIQTARAGDRIGKLIYQHNDVSLLWLHALFVYCTEGAVACYNYTSSDEKYGSYTEKQYKDVIETHKVSSCPNCGQQFSDETMPDGFDSSKYSDNDNDNNNENSNGGSNSIDNTGTNLNGNNDSTTNEPNSADEYCQQCQSQVTPNQEFKDFEVTRLIGETKYAKSRVNMEVYGGLNVKIPNYARYQSDCPYLTYAYESNYAAVIEEYEHLHGNKNLLNNIDSKSAGSYDQYDQWARLSPQYQGEYPINVVTCKYIWMRPAMFNVLNDKEDVDKLKALFPKGVKAVFVNNEYAEACPEELDDHWTILYNPMSNYIHFDPPGLLLASIQEITNDLVSLILQTIEHGVGMTFVSPDILDFKAFEQTEVTPGSVFPSKPMGNKRMGDGVYELKTAVLGGEVLPFQETIQKLGQLVSGATPSIFGGALEGSNTASEYSMSKSQALQRLQNTWKMFTIWWKTVFSKAIPMYISLVKEDERDVQRSDNGQFINILIKRAELEGKIGKIELDANENLPITWSERKSIIMSLLQSASPEVMKILNAPENLPLLHEAIGLAEFYLPGEDDIEKQYDEIKLLLNSEPITVPPTPEMIQTAAAHGVQPPQQQEIASVDIDPDFDNHPIQFEICRKWIIGDEGRQAKTDNPNGYKNVLLHGKAHLDEMQQQAAQAQMQQMQMGNPNSNGNNNKQSRSGAAPTAKPNPKLNEAPIQGDNNVATIQ